METQLEKKQQPEFYFEPYHGSFSGNCSIGVTSGWTIRNRLWKKDRYGYPICMSIDSKDVTRENLKPAVEEAHKNIIKTKQPLYFTSLSTLQLGYDLIIDLLKELGWDVAHKVPSIHSKEPGYYNNVYHVYVLCFRNMAFDKSRDI